MLSRSVIATRLSANAMRPAMTRGYPTSQNEGATATSQGFNKREQAEEGAYAKRQEAAQLAKLREELNKTKAENAELTKKLQEKSK